MPSPAASVATQIWQELRNGSWARLRSWGVHAAMDLADGVSPFLEVLPEPVQRVPVLGEDEQSATGVFQFVELGPGQAFA